jgi:hypothetical protein
MYFAILHFRLLASGAATAALPFCGELGAIHFGSLHCGLAYIYLASVVGIAKRYDLVCPGSNPGLGEIFRTRPDRP